MTPVTVLRPERAARGPLLVLLHERVFGRNDATPPALRETLDDTLRAFEAAALSLGGTVVRAPSRDDPHARAAASARCAGRVEALGRCLFIDAGAFAPTNGDGAGGQAQPVDVHLADASCHAPDATVVAVADAATRAGLRVERNTRFAGCPLPHRSAPDFNGMAALRIAWREDCALDPAPLIQAALRFEAFRHTTYCVHPADDEEIRIRIGAPCPALDALLAREGATDWVFVTAHNPHARPASPTDNEAAQARLRAELAMRGLVCFAGEGRGDLGDWAPEPSLLVLGVDAADARELAERHAQAAVVVGRRGGAAGLVVP